MSLTEDKSQATYQITHISNDAIVVNDHAYTHSLVITPEKLITDWRPTSADNITDTDLEIFFTLNPEIILLGLGKKSVILRAQKLKVLHEKQFHVECMSTASAARTYTALIAENRRVAAGLII